jgi:N-acetylmuramoyl-L-alanine amidase
MRRSLPVVLLALAAVTAPVAPAQATGPLAGRVIALDPGHQLGNSSHLSEINRLVDAGGFRKPCNTTGTSTNGGYAESALNMSVVSSLKTRLEALGARVYLTRSVESRSLWGPCVDVRGRYGERVHADLLLSVHGDGAPAQYRGFFVIRPALRRGWTDDVYTRSGVLQQDVRAGLDAVGLPRSNQYAGGLSTRSDLGTLNWSDVPVAMVELGNMRNAGDAARMTSARTRAGVYAAGLALGVQRYLAR